MLSRQPMGSATVFTYLSNLCNSRVAPLFPHPHWLPLVYSPCALDIILRRTMLQREDRSLNALGYGMKVT